MIGGRYLALILGALLLVLVVGSGYGTTAALVVPNQESYTHYGVSGVAELKGGRSNLGTDYVASWDREGFSETVTMTGKLTGQAQMAGTAKSIQYRLYAGDTLVFESPKHAVTAGNPVTLPSHTYAFKGAIGKDVALKLELHAEFTRFGKVESKILAQDGARLLNGAGELKIVGQSDRFAEGEKVTLQVTTGNGGPWKVDVYRGTGERACGLNSGKLTASAGTWFSNVRENLQELREAAEAAGCATMRFTGEFDGKLTFTVPTGAFRSDGKNEWKFVLYNEVWKRGEERAFVIDNSKLAPEVPAITITPPEAEVGDTVTIKATSRANAVSKAPVSKYLVRAWYGSSDQMPAEPENMILDAEIPATVSGSAFEGSTSIIVRKAAHVQYRVSAVDAAGRPSGTAINAAQVKELEDGGMSEPNDNARGVIRIEGANEEVGLAPVKDTDAGLVFIAVLLSLVLGVLVFRFAPGAPVQRGAFALMAAAASVWLVLGVLA